MKATDNQWLFTLVLISSLSKLFISKKKLVRVQLGQPD